MIELKTANDTLSYLALEGFFVATVKSYRLLYEEKYEAL